MSEKTEDEFLGQFIADFAEQLDDTPVDEIDGDTEFQLLDEWGSMTAMAVVAMVERKWGKKITGKDIRGCESVRELFELVQGR